MSKKSKPGDGQHGKGGKGTASGEAPLGTVGFVVSLCRGLVALLRR